MTPLKKFRASKKQQPPSQSQTLKRQQRQLLRNNKLLLWARPRRRSKRGSRLWKLKMLRRKRRQRPFKHPQWLTCFSKDSTKQENFRLKIQLDSWQKTFSRNLSSQRDFYRYRDPPACLWLQPNFSKKSVKLLQSVSVLNCLSIRSRCPASRDPTTKLPCWEVCASRLESSWWLAKIVTSSWATKSDKSSLITTKKLKKRFLSSKLSLVRRRSKRNSRWLFWPKMTFFPTTRNFPSKLRTLQVFSRTWSKLSVQMWTSETWCLKPIRPKRRANLRKHSRSTRK